MMNDNLLKKIKKNIYGKPQAVKVTFPPGLGAIALDEVQAILSGLWFEQKYSSQCTLLTNSIRIENIHLFAVTEILMRSQCITDVRLIIWEGKAFGKSTFIKKCRDISWDMYLSKDMLLKVKVNSIASRAFHESGLKEVLSNIVKDYAAEIVSGEKTHETTTLYADLYKDRLTISLSLAGASLYKRGYRGILSESAPLREDAASCCIARSLRYAREEDNDFLLNTLLIPFSGTGTFLFEYLMMRYAFSPILFDRDYALQKMPFFRQENFRYLLKKAQEHCRLALLDKQSDSHQDDEIHYFCIDTSKSANDALVDNISIFAESVKQHGFRSPLDESCEKLICHEDFIQMDMEKLFSDKKNKIGNVFIPLNPPYGIRLRNLDSAVFYAAIAKKINEIADLVQHEKSRIVGFILCPDEATWSAFCRVMIQAKTETYHFTQGGIDIRVCQFVIN